MTPNANAETSLHALSPKSIDGKAQPLSAYAGKVAVVVNTASQCGFTSQYKGLEAVYEKYKAKGVVVLGFPSNDFGAQEPGSNAEIKNFCESKFKVTFPLFEKNPVKGTAKQPVYSFLTEKSDPKFHGEVKWNFEKFVVDKKGNVVARFNSKVEPDSAEMTAAIEKALN